MAQFLDWAIYVPQATSVLALPVIGLLFARRHEDWIIYALAIYFCFITVLMVALSLAGPSNYAQRKVIGLSLLSFIGTVVNLGVAAIIGFGLFRYGDYVRPAGSILSVTTLDRESSDAVAQNVFIVHLRVKGGEEALAGRIPWVANTTFKRGALIDSSDLSWAARPCHQVSTLDWDCNQIFLGTVKDCGLKLNIFPTLASAKGVNGILDGWRQCLGQRCPVRASASG